MRVLITGYGGFVGPHLAAELRAASGCRLWGTVYQDGLAVAGPAAGQAPVERVDLDLRDATATRELLDGIRPDWVFHLAAQSSGAAAWRDPWPTLECNLRMQLSLLEAIRALWPAGGPRLLVASTSEVYGPSPDPIDEEAPLSPRNPYAVSKAAQDLLAGQYGHAYGLDVVRLRPFSHIGPGQDDRFVAASFARQVAEAEAGLRPPVIRVGDLSARRDFCDVRDMVRAYRLAAERAPAGSVYNLGSGRAVPIRQLLDHLVARAGRSLTVEVDPDRLRPGGPDMSCCQPGRAERELGWRPEIPLAASLDDILADWRARLVSAAPAADGL